MVQEVFQNGNAAFVEIRLGDDGILLPDVRAVLVVFFWRGAEDGQVDIDDEIFIALTGSRAFGIGCENELRDFPGEEWGNELSKTLGEKIRAPRFVVAGEGIVNGIVEPDREFNGLVIGSDTIHVGKHTVEMGEVVVVAVGFGVAGDEVVPS